MATELDRAWSDFSDHFRQNIFPALVSSDIALSIPADDGQFDVRQAAEVGASLILDKPVIILVVKGRTISDRLRRCADVVLDDWDMNNPASLERLQGAIDKIRGSNNANNEEQRAV